MPDRWTRLTEDLLPHWPPLTPDQAQQVAGDCRAFMRAHLGLAPLFVRAGLAAMLTAYWLWAIPFRSPSAALRAFSNLPLPMVRNLERLLRSSLLVCYLEHPLVIAALGDEPGEARQARFRAMRAKALAG